jgi:ligand-binding sensor domain-containing protein
MSKYAKYLLGFFLVSQSVVSWGQYSQMLFESIQNIPGLPSNRIRCIAKDSLGFFWYGTTMGLSRSDGNHYEAFVYEPFDSLGVPAPHITQIMITKNNLIWCKSDDGLVFYYDAKANPENRFNVINFKIHYR